MADLNRWYDLYDKAYQKAVEEGQFDNLRGTGKPLDLKTDDDVPDELRYAFKLMRENDIAPEWIMSGKALEHSQERLTRRAHTIVQRFYAMNADAERVAANQRTIFRRNAREKFDMDKRNLEKDVVRHNKEVTDYNLKVPNGIVHRTYFNLDTVLGRLLDATGQG
ncbi:MAG: DUF1992 domain-containing protein [Aggregatilineales bacterium]